MKLLRHQIAAAWLLVIFSFFIRFPSVSGEAAFSVERIGQIICYSDNTFQVNAPENGALTISISAYSFVFRTIRAEVQQGENRIEWDGLGHNGEKLSQMVYHFDADLTGESGTMYHIAFDSPVEKFAQALVLALPSSDTVYLDRTKEWFLECKVTMSGTLVVEMIPEGEELPRYTFRKPIEPVRINHFLFSEICGKTEISPGRYLVKVYEMSNPAYHNIFSLEVENGCPEEIPVGVTGRIMPEENDTDEKIWELMMQPAVVVDIGNTSHQNVYEKPDETSASLGTLHGQTQSLCVLEISEGWALIEAWNHEEGEKITGWVPAGKLKTVTPSKEYGLLLDKKTQTMTVLRNGKRIDTFLVCTGRMEKNELYQETAAGSFLTGEHRVDYSMNGKKYDFVIQYDGGNLIHQIPYAFGDGKKDFTEGRALLGAKGSHACIRLPSEPGPESGVNAYWIWTHIPYRTRLIILDDPDERHAMKSILEGTAGKEQHDRSAYAVENEYDDTIVMTFGGDAVLGGRESYYSRDDSLMAYIRNNGMGYPFSGLQEYFATDDLTSINLECVLKANKNGEREDKTWRFRGLPEYSQVLTEGSVELVNLANNHTMDYGEAGYESTIEAIRDVAAWCGNEHPVAVDIKGHRFGFGGCRETTYKRDPGIIARDIQALKDMGCECIIYQCHWGLEYSEHFNALQQAMAHACVRAGADLVIGHHPHVVQGMDYIEGVPVVYSLGNLCFGGTIMLSGYDAALARVIFSFDETEKPEISIKMIPILTSSRANEYINDYHPVAATGEDYRRIYSQIQNDSGFLLP